MKTRRQLELLLEDLPCDFNLSEYYDTSDELIQSCGSGILADGRLADLIRRVATFGMVLMKARLAPDVLLFYYRRSCYPRLSLASST
ncbi:putative phosphoenolpyruvate carboxylase [Rosa chinensis]|uniref:Putative phosphoenolpyruvate carboxylase n=1 Tax=Rosa chinensis TaxID=74649 RepID=A0A2P6Q653_ROSCH|nr:putative phosphoenolpyruvate carboxylase [Rosa chinensis]PRQ56787.1 putative phosphoenolpyruvate carboxylase [Rosa chinensis]